MLAEKISSPPVDLDPIVPVKKSTMGRGKLLGMVLFSITLALTLSELMLRTTSLHFLLGPTKQELYEIVQYESFVPDERAGYDLAEQRPPHYKTYWYDQERYAIWSNSLGCYDAPLSEADQKKGFGLLLGDSFGYGSSEFPRSFGSVIERASGTRIAKCGVGGYGTKQEYQKYRKILQRLAVKPSFVLLQYYIGNDLFDDYISPALTAEDGFLVPRVNYAQSDFSTGVFPLYSEKEKKAARQKILSEVRTPYSLIIGRLLGSAIGSGDDGRYRKIPSRTPSSHSPSFLRFSDTERPWLKKAWEEHKATLHSFFTDLRAQQIPFVVVVIPTNDQVYPFLMPDEEKAFSDRDLPDTLLKQFFDKEGVSSLFLRTPFSSVADATPKLLLDPEKDLYKKYDGHFSERGDELAGYFTAAKLLQEGLITPEKEKERSLLGFAEVIGGKRSGEVQSPPLKVLQHGPLRAKGTLSCQSLPSGTCGLWMKVAPMSSTIKAFLNGVLLPTALNLQEGIVTTEVAKEVVSQGKFVIELQSAEGSVEVEY